MPPAPRLHLFWVGWGKYRKLPQQLPTCCCACVLCMCGVVLKRQLPSENLQPLTSCLQGRGQVPYTSVTLLYPSL